MSERYENLRSDKRYDQRLQVASAPLRLKRFITETIMATQGWFWHSNLVYFVRADRKGLHFNLYSKCVSKLSFSPFSFLHFSFSFPPFSFSFIFFPRSVARRWMGSRGRGEIFDFWTYRCILFLNDFFFSPFFFPSFLLFLSPSSLPFHFLSYLNFFLPAAILPP